MMWTSHAGGATITRITTKNMKKILFLFLLLITFLTDFAQIKMGDFPLLLGRGDSVYIPVIVGNANRRMYGVDLAYGKVDSITISNDSLYQYRKGTKLFVGMVNQGSGGAAIDSLDWSRLNGNIFGNTALQSEFNTKQNSITPGTAAQYFKGNFTLGNFEPDVRAITDSFYSPIGHQHQTSDIVGLGQYIRNQLHVSGSATYDPSTGNLVVSSGTGTGGTYNNVLSPLTANGDTIKLTAVPASILTGTKTHTFISDWNASVLALLSANGPVQYNSGTGNISLDTISGTGAATKLRLYKALDSSLRINPYSPLFTGSYNDPSWLSHFSYNKLLGIPPLADSLSKYAWTVYGPLHVAFNTTTALDTLYIDTATAVHAGVLLPVDFTKIQNAVPSARTLTINGVTYDLTQNRSWTIAGGSGSGGDTLLSQARDVLFSTLANNNGLVFNGVKWTNQPLTPISFTSVRLTDVIAPDGSGGLKNVPAIVFDTTGAAYHKYAVWDTASKGLVLISLPANPTINITGDITGSGTPNIAATLASILTPGACTNCNVTFDAKGRATAYSNGSSGGATLSLPTNQIAVGTGSGVGSSANLMFNSAVLSLGNTTAASTATPLQFNMGGTYSNAGGASPKQRIYDDGTNYMGLGVSASQLDYIVSNSAYSHNFYIAGAKYFQITTAGAFTTGNENISANLTVQSLKSGNTPPATTGTKMMLVSDANGLVSFQTIPTGSGSGTLTNFSMTGAAALAFTVTNATTTPNVTTAWTSDNSHYVLGDGSVATKITNLNQLINGPNYLIGNQTIVLGGDLTGSGTTGITAALASIIAPSTCTNCNITYDAKGRITAASNGSAGTGGDGNNYPTAVSVSSLGAVTISRNGLTDITSAAASGTWGISVTGNAATATNATQLSSTPLSSAAHYWSVVPFVSSSGGMEAGQYIDLHNTTSDAGDYSVRIETNGTTGLKINGTPLLLVPATTGQIGKFLTTDLSGNLLWGGIGATNIINGYMNSFGAFTTLRPDSIYFASYASTTGTLSVSDNIGVMIRKLDGNQQLKANATGSNATGTWPIGISGNAATATSAAALSANLPVSKLNSGTGATTATFFTGGGTNGTWTNVLTNGSSTAGTAYLTFLPNDFGTGKPEFYFQKSTIASQWDLVLWDGATNNGTINFVSSALTWNGSPIITAATQTGEANVGQNLGTGTGVYAGKSGVNLQFNAIKGGIGTVAGQSGNDIIVQNNAFDQYFPWLTTTTTSTVTSSQTITLADNTVYNVEVIVVGYGGSGDDIGSTYKYVVKKIGGVATVTNTQIPQSPSGSLVSSFSGVQLSGGISSGNFVLTVFNGSYSNTINWKVIIKVTKVTTLS